MARNPTPTASGRPRASLRLVAGRGMTPEAVRDESDMELAVLRDETLASARRMRLVVMASIWQTEAFAPVAKPLIRELDRIERRLADPEGSAA